MTAQLATSTRGNLTEADRVAVPLLSALEGFKEFASGPRYLLRGQGDAFPETAEPSDILRWELIAKDIKDTLSAPVITYLKAKGFVTEAEQVEQAVAKLLPEPHVAGGSDQLYLAPIKRIEEGEKHATVAREQIVEILARLQ